MGMRAATGLHRTDLQRLAQIGNIKDPYTLKPLCTGVGRHALATTVETTAGLLDRHNQKIADDRNVALTTRADNRCDQVW